MSIDILEEAREILRKEILALGNSSKALDQNFVSVVQVIHRAEGKVVVTGVGKSGLIGQKIAATMASTGTMAVFMHAADAIHGDLGTVGPKDVVLALSHSGQTDEILDLIAPIRRIGAQIVALVGDAESELARAADYVIRLDVPEEADHLNLAPTASALAALGIGDALAGVLSRLRGFCHDDFALYHPGGAIGRRLLLKVKDLMHGGDQHPLLTPSAGMDEVLTELTEKRLGGVNIVDNLRSSRLVGLIVDGDLKRLLKQREKFFDLKAGDVMTRNPVTVRAEDKAVHALELMENRPSQIYVLPVVNEKGRAVGMLRLHDLMRVF
ncbi:MAG TPA: KpsF/GutQ family sugar-phosphate isomerase [Sumerlaeia bacterium]|nr:KpsF/GutQ family sugar-phosphate isomerase [Sumerlaeia bacterium]